MELSDQIRQVRTSAQNLGVYEPLWDCWEAWIIQAARLEREIGDLREQLGLARAPSEEQNDATE